MQIQPMHDKQIFTEEQIAQDAGARTPLDQGADVDSGLPAVCPGGLAATLARRLEMA
jgi:hypothetical protein